MRVLVIKTSSMGDVIHALPALTDAQRAIPRITFDWVVEEAFAEIPGWHPAVDQVIPVAIRRWRRSLYKTWSSTEWRQFKTQMRRHHYDLVIDCQGLLKSAWLGSLLKAPVAGMDKHSVREPLAALFYRHRYSVPKQMHAVERIRSLFAQALNYEKPRQRGDYNINRQRFCGSVREPANVVFLHATAREDKLYPETYWRGLAGRLVTDGYRIRLPWGEEHERERAQRIAEGIEGVEVLPRLNLQGVACVLAQANAVVAVDTGLGHLSAALNIPTLTLYGPTDPELVGTYGDNQFHLCTANRRGAEHFADLTPERVYDALQGTVFSENRAVAQHKLS
jgi:heptosyltransferase I